MVRRQVEELPIGDLKERISRWRVSKSSYHEPMPKELWDQALEMAGKYGACRVSRELGIDYHKVRVQLRNFKIKEIEKGTKADGGSFVEVLGLRRSGQINVEVHKGDGSLLRIELNSNTGGSDISQIVCAFMCRQ